MNEQLRRRRRAPLSRRTRLGLLAILAILAGLVIPAPTAHAWKGEFNLPSPDPAVRGAITSVARHVDALDVFWILPDGSISSATWTAAAGRWVNRPVAPAGSAQPGEFSGALSAVSRNPDHLDLFWIRPDGGVSTSWWHVGDVAWAPARSIAPARHALYGTLTAVARNLGQLDVFWIGPDRAIGTTAWNPSHGWLTPWPITPSGVAHGSAGAVTVVSRTRDQLDLFWIRPDGGVSTAWWNAQANWPSRSIAPAGHALIGSSREWRRAALTAVSHRPDQLDVFWIGPDGGIGTTVWKDRVLNWPAPWPIAWPGAAQPGSLDVVSRSPGRFDLVWVGPNNQVQGYAFDERIPGSWAVAPVSGVNAAQPGAISLTSRHPTLLDAFWIRPDGTIGTNWWRTERVRVHVKIVNQPTATFDPISTQLNNAATGFAQAEIGVDVITVERIQVTGMDTLDVGACSDFQPTTAQQNTLYGHRNNVQPGEIVLYIVKAIKQDGVDGCATHPAGRPGAIVEYSSHPWALAHETGHVLGLEHPDCGLPGQPSCAPLVNRLMFPHFNLLSKPVPEISSTEKVTLFGSPLTN